MVGTLEEDEQHGTMTSGSGLSTGSSSGSYPHLCQDRTPGCRWPPLLRQEDRALAEALATVVWEQGKLSHRKYTRAHLEPARGARSQRGQTSQCQPSLSSTAVQ